ncbi:hypothetical protein DFJ73DRAFT_66667 [Zopfochytrium polystomum]|nr:hypothetical protein DFJ73DRAFT_66667 [Zopfochytrium polystomum]
MSTLTLTATPLATTTTAATPATAAISTAYSTTAPSTLGGVAAVPVASSSSSLLSSSSTSSPSLSSSSPAAFHAPATSASLPQPQTPLTPIVVPPPAALDASVASISSISSSSTSSLSSLGALDSVLAAIPTTTKVQISSLSIVDFDDDSEDALDSDAQEGRESEDHSSSPSSFSEHTWASAYTSAVSSFNLSNSANPNRSPTRPFPPRSALSMSSSSSISSLPHSSFPAGIPESEEPEDEPESSSFATLRPSVASTTAPQNSTAKPYSSPKRPPLSSTKPAHRPQRAMSTPLVVSSSQRPMLPFSSDQSGSPQQPSLPHTTSEATLTSPLNTTFGASRTLTAMELKNLRHASTISQNSILSRDDDVEEEDRFLAAVQRRLTELESQEKMQSPVTSPSREGSLSMSPPTSPPSSPPSRATLDGSLPTLTKAQTQASLSTLTRPDQPPLPPLSAGGAGSFSFFTDLFTKAFRSRNGSPSTSPPTSSSSLSDNRARYSTPVMSYRPTTMSPSQSAHTTLPRPPTAVNLRNRNLPPSRNTASPSNPTAMGHSSSAGMLSPRMSWSSLAGVTPSPTGIPRERKPTESLAETRKRLKEGLQLFEMGALEAAAATFGRAVETSDGEPLARYCWGACMLHGFGTQRSSRKAMLELELSARDGEILAMHELGRHLRRSLERRKSPRHRQRRITRVPSSNSSTFRRPQYQFHADGNSSDSGSSDSSVPDGPAHRRRSSDSSFSSGADSMTSSLALPQEDDGAVRTSRSSSFDWDREPASVTPVPSIASASRRHQHQPRHNAPQQPQLRNTPTSGAGSAAYQPPISGNDQRLRGRAPSMSSIASASTRATTRTATGLPMASAPSQSGSARGSSKRAAMMRWFSAAAELGHRDSQIALAELLVQDETASKIDRHIAGSYLRTAAAANEASGRDSRNPY